MPILHSLAIKCNNHFFLIISALRDYSKFFIAKKPWINEYSDFANDSDNLRCVIVRIPDLRIGV